jgi:hypothetical protein
MGAGNMGDLAKTMLSGQADSFHAQLLLTDVLPEGGYGQMFSVEPGEKVLIRTVTNYFTGEVVVSNFTEIVLKHAAWIPDTGRFSECLQNGTPSDIEPYPDPVHVAVGAIVDLTKWRHKLPGYDRT